ncbi:MAG: hypothetical protein IJD43_04880 [Thermoguttaceae bacterium]|nr:hypothetical protein [Thermoguttaceae bacterium]
MLAKSEIVLKNLKSGVPETFTLRRMTIRDKCSLDEWIRRRYVADALQDAEIMKSSIQRKIVFATANELDFLVNSWAASDQIWLARLIWQCVCWATDTMNFDDFFVTFFNQEMGDGQAEEFYKQNWNASRESRGFIAGENPTVAKNIPESQASHSGNVSSL